MRGNAERGTRVVYIGSLTDWHGAGNVIAYNAFAHRYDVQLDEGGVLSNVRPESLQEVAA